MQEEWRDIEGYEGLYEVSSLGRVKSLKYGKEKILRQGKNKGGYLYVSLCKEVKIKTCKVHRLVANAFIPNPSNLPQVNHKDENKENNTVGNLEWCDAKYNNTYGTRITKAVANTDYKAISEKRTAKLSRQVYQYTLEGKLIKIWKSTRDCDRNNFKHSNVSACCRNCFKREGNNIYKGYIWSYTPIDSK